MMVVISKSFRPLRYRPSMLDNLLLTTRITLPRCRVFDVWDMYNVYDKTCKGDFIKHKDNKYFYFYMV